MCSCRKNKGDKASAGKFSVKLPGGLVVKKDTEAQAIAYAGRHPGATVIKS